MKNKLLAGLLALLGFSACSVWGDNDNDDGGGGGDVMMYGVLRETFVVKGMVTDKGEEPKPIEGIRIVLRPASEDMYEYFLNDTVYTAADGTFVTGHRPVEFPDGFSVTAADVDGKENGSFKPDERIFNFGPMSSDYSYEDGAYLKEVRFELEEAEGILE